jgi:hypothetical protein
MITDELLILNLVWLEILIVPEYVYLFLGHSVMMFQLQRLHDSKWDGKIVMNSE